MVHQHIAQLIIISQHAEYNRPVGGPTFSNDIAIIYVSQAFTTGSNIQFATLPADNSNNYDGTTCVISGWGRTCE